MRLYSPDFAERLRQAGLAVHAVAIVDGLPAGAADRYGLVEDETVFHCVRPTP